VDDAAVASPQLGEVVRSRRRRRHEAICKKLVVDSLDRDDETDVSILERENRGKRRGPVRTHRAEPPPSVAGAIAARTTKPSTRRRQRQSRLAAVVCQPSTVHRTKLPTKLAPSGNPVANERAKRAVFMLGLLASRLLRCGL
jgi:hypothetical protein